MSEGRWSTATEGQRLWAELQEARAERDRLRAVVEQAVKEVKAGVSLVVKANAERDRLRAVVKDIAAHANPIAEDDDGFVAVGYTVTVGAIHRALAALGQLDVSGVIGPDEAAERIGAGHAVRLRVCDDGSVVFTDDDDEGNNAGQADAVVVEHSDMAVRGRDRGNRDSGLRPGVADAGDGDAPERRGDGDRDHRDVADAVRHSGGDLPQAPGTVAAPPPVDHPPCYRYRTAERYCRACAAALDGSEWFGSFPDEPDESPAGGASDE